VVSTVFVGEERPEQGTNNDVGDGLCVMGYSQLFAATKPYTQVFELRSTADVAVEI
jgi:hypothetical protein